MATSGALNVDEYRKICKNRFTESARKRQEISGYLPGDFINTTRLRNAKHLNQQVGYVCNFDETTGRYIVHLISVTPNKKIKVKCTNLLPTHCNPFRDHLAPKSVVSFYIFIFC